jgi:ADP-heptose:LPS heptosyltransferase
MAALKRCAGASTLRAGAYACVHPGARSATRRWPVERFAEVADGLSEHGLRVVLTGSGEEQELTRAVSDRMKAPAVDLAGELDLGGMAAIIADARLLVSNDTGVSHLASALGVPSVIVFSASDPARWAPLDRARHRCVLPVVEGRIPCGHPGCHTDRPCSLSIPAEPVWREVRDLLESA